MFSTSTRCLHLGLFEMSTFGRLVQYMLLGYLGCLVSNVILVSTRCPNLGLFRMSTFGRLVQYLLLEYLGCPVSDAFLAFIILQTWVSFGRVFGVHLMYTLGFLWNVHFGHVFDLHQIFLGL